MEKLKLRISDIITDNGLFGDGDWIESKDQNPSGDVRIIQLADIGDGKFINKSNRFMTYEKAQELNCTFLNDGDVLIARMPDPLGRTCIYKDIGQKAVTVVDIGIIRPENPDVSNDYLKYLINSSKFRKQIKKYTTGTTRKRISKKNLNKITFELLSKSDQIKIANLLTQVESLITKRKESMVLLDELLKSTFLDMFGDPVLNPKGWDKVLISECCIDIVDCVNKTAPTVEYETPYKMIRTTNVRNHKVTLEETRKVDKETFEKWTRRLKPRRNDIVFTREAPVGESGIILSDDEVFLGQRTMMYRVDMDIMNPEYLLYELMGSSVQQQIRKISTGSTVKHLSVPNCKKFRINLAPKPLQDKFATIVQQVEATKTYYQDSLDELNELFGSLSQRAFRGELDLRKKTVSEMQEVEHIRGRARSGAGDGEHTGIIEDNNKETTFLDKVIDKLSSEYKKAKELNKISEKEKKNNIPKSYVDNSNNPIYSEEFLWMLLQQSDDDIDFESINAKLEKFSFREHPSYDQVQINIFSLIKKEKLEQKFDMEEKRIILSKVL